MSALFLLGGGGSGHSYVRTYFYFLKAAQGKKARILVIMAEHAKLDKEEAEGQCRRPFAALGLNAEDVSFLYVSAEQPLTEAMLAEREPTGIFMAGGPTPAYHDALCNDRGWCDYMIARDIPYAGFSAGACVLAEKAIVGGWKMALKHKDVQIANQGYGEGVDYLEVRPGLGLVPFAVEAHATSWGTPTRLMHAVQHGLVNSGWAIDDDTMLRIEGDRLSVMGLGQAYRVRRLEGNALKVDIFGAGTDRQREEW